MSRPSRTMSRPDQARTFSPDSKLAMSSFERDGIGDVQPLRTRLDPSALAAAFHPIQVSLSGQQCGDLNRASKMEWLLTNGLGGYAMSTIVGMNTRRHHGLLVAAPRSPAQRLVVLSRMEERVVVPGAERALDTAFYPGVVHPRGYEHLTGFRMYPSPVWTFEGKRWKLEKQVDVVAGENTVMVTYRLLELESEPTPPEKGKRGQAGRDTRKAPGKKIAALESVTLRLRPLFAFRNSHDLSQKSAKLQKTFGVRSLDGQGSVVRCTPYPEWDPVYLVCRTAEFQEKGDWYRKVEYPQERYRGFDYREDLWSYGEYAVEMRAGDEVQIICTMHSPETHLSGWNPQRETERRVKVMASSPDESAPIPLSWLSGVASIR